MQPIRVYTSGINLLAEVDTYQSLQFERNYFGYGKFELHINRYMHEADAFNKSNIILLNKQGNKAGIIIGKEIALDEAGKETENFKLTGYALDGLVSRRVTVPPEGDSHDRVSGSAEAVMKHYIRRHFVDPADSKRRMPNLVIAPNQNRGPHIHWESRFKNVADELEAIGMRTGVGWSVWLDVVNRQFVFDVIHARDLTQDNAQGYSPVFFSPDFNTIRSQQFVDSDNEYRNFGYVGGQGEGEERKIVTVGEGDVGINRIETFIDARDLGEDEDGDLTNEEIEKLLKERGEQKLREMRRLLSFEAEILTPVQGEAPFEYEKDYDLGDRVDVVNKSWRIIMSAPIVAFNEVHEPGGFRLEATFGEEQPTILTKIKRKFDELTGAEVQEIPSMIAIKEMEQAKRYADHQDLIYDEIAKEDASEKANRAEQNAKDYTLIVADNVEYRAQQFTEQYAQKRISQGYVPPNNPSIGDLWIDITPDPHMWKRWNGSEWEALERTNLEQMLGELQTEQIANGAIISEKLADLAVTLEKIADNAVDTSKILDDAIDEAKIAANAVTSGKIANGAVGNTKLEDLAVTAEKIGNGAVETVKLADLSVDTSKIKEGAVTTDKIVDNAVTGGKIVNNAITTTKITDDAITTDKIAANAITANEISSNAVTAVKINANAVTADKIATNAVTAAKINAGAVTTDKLDALAVTADKIAANAITTAKLSANAVTTDKIAAGAITAESAIIANGAIGTAAIQDAAITNAKIKDIHADKITAGRINAERIQIGNGTEFADGYDPEENYRKVLSRRENLVVNGNGFLKDLTNFTSWTAFDGAVANGGNGSFRRTSGAATIMTDELIAVNPNSTYRISFDKRADSAGVSGGGRFYSAIVAYDRDGNRIQAHNIMYRVGSLTKLASDLNNGDTVVHLEDVSGFEDTPTTHRQRLIFWDYVSNDGYAYPVETYSQNVTGAALWNVGAIDYGNNTITLSSPWSGGSKSAGTPLSQGSSGSTYPYPHSNLFYTEEWTSYSREISGMGTSVSSGWVGFHSTKFPPYTADIRIGFLLNRDAGTYSSWLTNLEFYEITQELNAKAYTDIEAQDGKDAKQRVTLWQYEDTTFIDGGSIYANSVTANQIAAGTITANEIASNAITTAKINANAITAAKIAAGAVNADKIAANAVIADKIAANAVTTAKIAAGAVNADKIAAGTITSDLISTAGLDAGVIKFGTMSGERIQAGTITADQLGANSVTAAKIATNAVTSAKIDAGAVTASKISVNSLSAVSANLGNITAGNITGVNITGATITQMGTDGSVLMDNTGLHSRDQMGNKRISITTSNESFQGFSPSLIYFEPNTERFIVGTGAKGIGDGVIGWIENPGWYTTLALSSPGGKVSVTGDLSLEPIGVNGGIHLGSFDNHIIGVQRLSSANHMTLYPNRAQGVFKLRSHHNRSNYRDDMIVESDGGFIIPDIRNHTWSASPNVYCGGSGKLYTASSSRKYKKDIEDLDFEIAENVVENLRPVWYRSAIDNEDCGLKDWSYVGLIAEEVAEVEPRLVDYRTTDREGNKLHEPVPQGVQYANLAVYLLPIVKQLRKQMDEVLYEVNWLKIENQYLKQKVKQLEGDPSESTGD